MEWTAVRGTVHGGCTEWFPDGRVKSLANYGSGIELKFQEWNEAGELVIARELPGGSPLRALVERERCGAVLEPQKFRAAIDRAITG